MNARELRQKYLAFFKSKGHDEHPSGSLVPYDVTGRLDESLLFNGAGMVQFKPYFRGVVSPPNKKLCNVQKCMRTGDIEEVGNLSHLTFFEMLGNFSFGDYFKEDAIAYSWEFMTSPEWLGLDPKRLCFTVFETDDEVYDLWAGHLESVGLDPALKIFRLGEDKNYWPANSFTSGPPGPCGPNSEMFYWVPNDEAPPSGSYGVSDYLRDDEAGKWLEIWNDVFISSDWQGSLRDPSRPDKGYEKTGLPDLPFQSVDTGMGLERTACVLGGFSSVYDTDAFTLIIAAIESCGSSLKYGADPEKDIAIRIVADHLRAASFCIADGVLPSNTGRGYVLRRLIRRAVLKGVRVLGFEKPFLHRCFDGVVLALGQHYLELGDRYAVVVETLKNEEEQFRRTLDQGLDRLDYLVRDIYYTAFGLFADSISAASSEWPEERLSELGCAYEVSTGILEYSNPAGNRLVANPKEPESVRRLLERTSELLEVVPADSKITALRDKLLRPGVDGIRAFNLYETYGIPYEVIEELATEMGLRVDYEGYLDEMAKAQERSRSGSGMDTVYGGVENGEALTEQATVFDGYSKSTGSATILGVQHAGEGKLAVALDTTPFYAESGGQVGDTGVLVGDGIELKVINVKKQDGVFVHLVEKVNAPDDMNGASVEARVDVERRTEIVRNHTATHLMHAALRNVLGEHVTQAGSLVNEKHLRFDFTHGSAMAVEEIAEVERIVNDEILKAQAVKVHEDVAIQDAREMGAMALFGEKYSDRVRVVQIGDMPVSENSFSRELCGGIHVKNTGEIGLFKIMGEASAASGVRRIEAVTGLGAIAWANDQRATVEAAAALLKSQPAELLTSVEKTLSNLKEEKRKRERLAQQGAGSTEQIEKVGSVQLAVEKLYDADSKDAQMVADRLTDGKPDRVALVVLVAGGKLTFVCKVGDSAKSAGAHAGNLIREVAKVAGGGGGGRPDFATAGGKDASKVDEAIAKAREVLAVQVGS